MGAQKHISEIKVTKYICVRNVSADALLIRHVTYKKPPQLQFNQKSIYIFDAPFVEAGKLCGQNGSLASGRAAVGASAKRKASPSLITTNVVAWWVSALCVCE